jgi:hypothetical protein
VVVGVAHRGEPEVGEDVAVRRRVAEGVAVRRRRTALAPGLVGERALEVGEHHVGAVPQRPADVGEVAARVLGQGGGVAEDGVADRRQREPRPTDDPVPVGLARRGDGQRREHRRDGDRHGDNASRP